MEIIKIDKEGNEAVETISSKIEFIDSARFMASALSNLIENLTEVIRNIKCKDCNCFLEYESVEDTFIKYKCLSCNKNYLNKPDGELKKKFENRFKFSNNDINNFFVVAKKRYLSI